tara:strand:- start:2510 stop:2956 length:447 start_codon:yes stop_codon:yes gene_type:complete
MITFLVNKDDTEKTFECSLEDSILSLKNKIIQDFDLSCDYIDIDFQLERPIRSLGKFNLESGILPRPLDNYTFDRYGLDGKTVNATFHIVEDYDHKKYSKKFSKKYNHINVLKTREEMKIDENFEKSYNESKNINFNLNSESDFPSLK